MTLMGAAYAHQAQAQFLDQIPDVHDGAARYRCSRCPCWVASAATKACRSSAGKQSRE
jgi:hypothetical protein